MKQRFLSGFIIVALMASVFAGAMGVSLRYASANQPDANDIVYLADFEQYLIENSDFNIDQLTAFFDFVLPKVNDIQENEMYLVSMIVRESSVPSKLDVAISLFERSPTTTKFLSRATGGNFVGIGVDPLYGDNRIRQLAYLNFNYAQPTNNRMYVDPNLEYTNYNYSRQTAYGFAENTNAFGSLWDFNNSSNNCYYSKEVTGLSPTCPHNLYAGERPDPTLYFDLGVFWLGNRQYISILQQDLIRDLDPEHLNDAELIVYLYAAGEGDYKTFSYDDVSLIPGDWQFFINLNFTNVSPMGLYAIDITGNDWDIITGGEIYDSDSFPEPYAISDSRIEMNQGVPGTDGTPDSYTQVFNYFTEYANNYNRTHYIPENLADTLFGLNGSRLYPCEVSVPVVVWNANSTGGSSFADSHNWKWWFPSRDNYGINFELMDVVIVTEPYNDRYSLLYYYSDSLNVPFQYIQNMTFDELLEEFDCIIIVPDDLNCLDGNVWWKNLLTEICNFLGISNLTSNLLTSLAMSGSDSNGVEYVTERPDEVPGTLQGFCIVTKKAIQRQQLYVFNEGITKTYELMSNYLDERGKWEDSFLEWSMSLFYQWQTLDGKLGDIYNLLYGWNLSSVLSDISESLARIANNTSEEDPGYWFLSLFNWLNRFSVTDSDFANWVSEYDDFTDDLPDPGTGATVIPFPTAIPTVAVGG